MHGRDGARETTAILLLEARRKGLNSKEPRHTDVDYPYQADTMVVTA